MPPILKQIWDRQTGNYQNGGFLLLGSGGELLLIRGGGAVPEQMSGHRLTCGAAHY